MVRAEGAAVVAGVAVVGDAVVDVEVGGEELGGAEGFDGGAEAFLEVRGDWLRGVRPEVPFNAVVRCWEVPCKLDLYDGVALQLADDDVGVLFIKQQTRNRNIPPAPIIGHNREEVLALDLGGAGALAGVVLAAAAFGLVLFVAHAGVVGDYYGGSAGLLGSPDFMHEGAFTPVDHEDEGGLPVLAFAGDGVEGWAGVVSCFVDCIVTAKITISIVNILREFSSIRRDSKESLSMFITIRTTESRWKYYIKG